MEVGKKKRRVHVEKVKVTTGLGFSFPSGTFTENSCKFPNEQTEKPYVNRNFKLQRISSIWPSGLHVADVLLPKNTRTHVVSFDISTVLSQA